MPYRDPVKNINHEYLLGLSVLSNREFPLPGARCRGGSIDPRHTHLAPGTGEITFFNHVATIRHRASDMVFVAFKKTMDALHFEQSDPTKYPSWLMDSDVKKTELNIYVHSVKAPYNKNPNLVTRDPSITDVTAQVRTDKWLAEITTLWVFDTVVYFLLKNNIVTQEMYGKMK